MDPSDEPPLKRHHSSSAVHAVNKPLGMTPLVTLQLFRQLRSLPPSVRMSYAGRLDPMAQGLLLLLEGDACTQQDTLQNHDKEYVWEMLLGFQTDSYDLLGLVSQSWVPTPQAHLKAQVDQLPSRVSDMVGQHSQPYPPYSSARFCGHPLFWWATQGRLNEVQPWPTIDVRVRAASVCSVRWVKAQSLCESIVARVSLVPGESFRQSPVCARWREVFASLDPQSLWPIVCVRCSVSSGTYVRSLANACSAVAWSIERVSVDKWSLVDAVCVVPVSAILMRKALQIVIARHSDVRCYVPI
jgi:tRNA pseudouridine(55) synthase